MDSQLSPTKSNWHQGGSIGPETDSSQPNLDSTMYLILIYCSVLHWPFHWLHCQKINFWCPNKLFLATSYYIGIKCQDIFIYLLPLSWHHDIHFDSQCMENGMKFPNVLSRNRAKLLILFWFIFKSKDLTKTWPIYDP